MAKRDSGPDTTASVRPLRLAVPKGRMTEMLFDYMKARKMNVPLSRNGRRLTMTNNDCSIKYILSKPADVPTFVSHGVADVGIAGLDNLREEKLDVLEPFMLPLQTWRMSLAGFPEWRNRSLREANHLRVATKYVRIASEFFVSKGISVEIIKLNGSVELAPLTGLSDLILDVVQTGSTLKANGLEELYQIMQCHPVVIVNRSAYHLQFAKIGRFLQTIHPPPPRQSAIQSRSTNVDVCQVGPGTCVARPADFDLPLSSQRSGKRCQR